MPKIDSCACRNEIYVCLWVVYDVAFGEKRKNIFLDTETMCTIVFHGYFTMSSVNICVNILCSYSMWSFTSSTVILKKS